MAHNQDFMRRFAGMAQQQQPAPYPVLGPYSIMPQPLPFEWAFHELATPNGKVVVLQLFSPQGTQMWFFPIAAFERFVDQARGIVSGIVLSPNGAPAPAAPTS